MFTSVPVPFSALHTLTCTYGYSTGIHTTSTECEPSIFEHWAYHYRAHILAMQLGRLAVLDPY
eukprot:SAG31_NODE_2063_length_6535_cov_7.578931_2_plen_63_part_00